MCIEALSKRNPCLYGSVLTIATFAAATVAALGIITVLANQNMLTLPNFSIGTPWSLGMLTAGSAIVGGVITLAIQHCTRSKKKGGENQETLEAKSKPIVPPEAQPKPNSPLNPDGNGGNTGASGGSSKVKQFEVVPQPRIEK